MDKLYKVFINDIIIGFNYYIDNDINKFITQIKPYEQNNIENKENKESETFVVGSDLWDIDCTQYFYSVCNNLKHEWNDTYQCKLKVCHFVIVRLNPNNMYSLQAVC